jgi:hydroxyacylglutathione hydrolase
MLLKRFYDDKLAQASYLIGSTKTGEAVVVDPMRDPQIYIDAAKAEGVRITAVTETHIHADFVSGAVELAERTGAKLYLSDEGPSEWKYAFAEARGAVLLYDGDTFSIGEIRIAVMHTPGHTPEHIVFLVTDTGVSEMPLGVVTGDFIFVGAVGRPDLLERAAGISGTMDALARQLFASLQRFRALPDYLQLWPGHGAGSACGKALGSVPQTTLGYEKMVNPGFTIDDEDRFVEWVLEGQPEPPKYFAIMKGVNKRGPRVLGGFPVPPRLDASRLPELLDAGATVVDIRGAVAYGKGHIPGTTNVPLTRTFSGDAGALLPYDRDLYLIGADDQTIGNVVRDLAMVGLERVAGWFAGDVLDAWTAAGRALGTVVDISADETVRRRDAGEARLVDVRSRSEFEAGHIPGAVNVPLPEFPDRAAALATEGPLVLYCETGRRSTMAASILQSLGASSIANYRDGVSKWQQAGRPLERGRSEAATLAPNSGGAPTARR